jgi:HK97 gp10 family phage protein
MQLQLTTNGFVETSKRFKLGARPAISKAVFRVANLMETTAKKNIKKSVYSSPKPSAPFSRSGKAQQSITVAKLDDLQSKVFMGVEYGQFLEYGTGIYRGRKPYWTTFGGQIDRPILYKGMKARPFWIPAVESTKKQIPEILKSEIDKL